MFVFSQPGFLKNLQDWMKIKICTKLRFKKSRPDGLDF